MGKEIEKPRERERQGEKEPREGEKQREREREKETISTSQGDPRSDIQMTLMGFCTKPPTASILSPPASFQPLGMHRQAFEPSSPASMPFLTPNAPLQTHSGDSKASP